MLNALFVGFVVVSLLYILLAPRKEVPVLIVLQALLQYVYTLSVWALRLPPPLGSILLAYLTATTLLLIWGRNLPYSWQWLSIRLFFTVSQWALLLMVALLAGLRSPYLYSQPHDLLGAHGGQVLTIHPVLKFGGNLMIFSVFFHILLHWGQHWSLRKSLLDLGPVLIYFLTLLLLRYLQATQGALPFA